MARVVGKVLAALVAALLVRLIVVHYMQQSIQSTLTTFGEQQQADFQRSMQKIQADAASRRAADEAARAQDLARRQLTPSQRCVAGTVVEVSGSSYTQVAGAGGRPAACEGRYRL